MAHIQILNMKTNYILAFTLATLFVACGGPKTVVDGEKQIFTRQEVGEIINNILYAGGKDLPYQAPADKPWTLNHTDLDISVDFEKHTINGTATLTLQPYYYSQDSLVLDAKKMDIFDVRLTSQNGTSNGPAPEKLNFRYSDSLHLIIKFKENYTANQKVQISIDYQANPDRKVFQLGETTGTAIKSDKGAYFINTDGKDPVSPMQMWTQGEPQANSCWFPTIDVPNQKHTHRIKVKYPAQLTCISNGSKISSQTEPYPANAGAPAKPTKTDVWEMNQPHAVYLTMLAIGDWKIVKDRSVKFDKEIPVQYFVEEVYASDAKAVFGNTPEMIEFFSSFTGVPFMWAKYDQIVARDFVSGAMENTTAVIHNERLHDPDNDMEDYVAHELFHHWFGDYVTCESWAHLTLNESFANYSEYLWREYKYGKANADAWMFENLDIDAESSNKNALVNHHFSLIDDQFDDIRYNKGAGILHRLRNHIGTDAFKASMKLYLSTHAYKNANVYDWKKCVETVTGTNMDHFFNTWYFSKGQPDLYVTLDNSTGSSVLNIINSTDNGEPTQLSYGKSKFLKLQILARTDKGRKIDTTITTSVYQELNEINFPNETLVQYLVDPFYSNALIIKGKSFIREENAEIDPDEIETNYQNLKFSQEIKASHIIQKQMYVDWLKSYVQFGVNLSKSPDWPSLKAKTQERFITETLNGLQDSNISSVWLPLANDFVFKPEEPVEEKFTMLDLFPANEATQKKFMDWITSYYQNPNINANSKLQFYNFVPLEMESKMDVVFPYYSNPKKGIEDIESAAKMGNSHLVVLYARIFYDLNKVKGVANNDLLYQFTLNTVSNSEINPKVRRDLALVQFSRLTNPQKKYDLMLAVFNSNLHKEYQFKICDRAIPFADETTGMENTQFLQKMWNSEVVKNSLVFKRMLKKATSKEWENLLNEYPSEKDIIKSSTKDRYKLIKVIQNVE